MRNLKRQLPKILLLLFLLGLILVVAAAIYFKSLINTPASEAWDKTELIIEKGEDIDIIAKALEEKGIIKNKDLFSLYAKLSGRVPEIKAGIHTVRPNMTLPEILEELTTAQITEVWITIPEGWRISQIANYLEKKDLIQSAADFEKQAKVDKYKADYWFLKDLPEGTSLEGYLFPDTYKVAAEPTIESIIRKMLDNFEIRFSDEYKQEAEAQGWKIKDLITFASIIEKESGRDADRGVIAGIFKNRLDSLKPLQSDASITYITKRPDTRPTIEETKIESPYNTYINVGLPPGPVGNPGLKAIRDSLYPTRTPYLFFITDSDGVAHFARTYDEHLRNIEKYLD